MKKIFVILLSAFVVLGVSSIARAESSAQTSSGTRYYENQVFITGYNNSGSDISSRQVVILDTSATAGTTLGAYITTTTTGSDQRVIGITDETIENGTSGRICVRGPHPVMVGGDTIHLAVGSSMATTTTAGRAGLPLVTNQPKGVIGTLLSTTVVTSEPEQYWIWVGNN